MKRMTTTDVTVIGLGLMGSALARALAEAGHGVTLWNRTLAKAERLAGTTARPAPTLAEAITRSPVIVVCVTEYSAARTLLEKADLSGKTIVQLSTGTPQDARECDSLVRARGADYLDGALLNVPSQVGKAESSVLVSGSRAAFERSRPFLDSVAHSVSYVGDRVGAAAALDFAILSVFFSSLLGLYHGARVLDTEGVGADVYGQVLAGTAPALGPMWQADAESIHRGSYETPEATLEICSKAVNLMARHAKEAGIEATVPAFLAKQFERGMAAGFGMESPASLYKLLRVGAP